MVGKTTFVPDVSLAVGSLAAIVPVAGQVVLSRPFSPRDRGDPFDLAVRPHLLHQVFLN
jgi:hypothetical protein